MTEISNKERDQNSALAPSTARGWTKRLLLPAVYIFMTAGAVAAFRFFHQPPVIGEIFGGILLGPSALGRVLPDFQAPVLPSDIAPTLGILVQLGIILFMFLIGLELNLRVLPAGPGQSCKTSSLRRFHGARVTDRETEKWQADQLSFLNPSTRRA